MPFAYEHKHMPHCRTASKLMLVRIFYVGRMRDGEGGLVIVNSHPLVIALSHDNKDA
jgi:hypothetical protein